MSNTVEVKSLEQMVKDATRIDVEVLEGGRLPYKGNWKDAGFDLYATEDVVVYPGQIIKHPLNIKMKLPPGVYAQITSKSGLGSKGFLVYAGIVDEEYRGIPHVVATNLNWNTKPFVDEDMQENVHMMPEPIIIKKGEKIAQMIIHPYNAQFYINEVDKVDADTSRGDGGFGSTGK